MATSDFRFRTSKTVGSPSSQGAGGIETLASHVENISAHPQYMKKTAEQAGFSRSEHIRDRQDHAPLMVLRAELASSKLDYELYKNMTLSNDPDNYLATQGVKPYLISAYVLNKVLQSVGIDGSENVVVNSKLLGDVNTRVSDQTKYAPNWKIFLDLWNRVNRLTTDPSEAFVTRNLWNQWITTTITPVINRVTAVENAVATAAAKQGYVLTGDTKFRAGITYYTFDDETNTFVVASVAEGDDVPSDTYWVKAVSSSRFMPNWSEPTQFAFSRTSDTQYDATQSNVTGTVIMSVHFQVSANDTRLELLAAMPGADTPYTKLAEFITVHSYAYGDYDFMHVDVMFVTRAIKGSKFRIQVVGGPTKGKITKMYADDTRVFNDFDN